jgi:hypothetical protein
MLRGEQPMTLHKRPKMWLSFPVGEYDGRMACMILRNASLHLAPIAATKAERWARINAQEIIEEKMKEHASWIQPDSKRVKT